MNILITMPDSKERDIFLPENLIDSLKLMGSVRLNKRNECYSQEEISNIIIEEIRRFMNGQPLEHEISFQRFKRMTKEV